MAEMSADEQTTNPLTGMTTQTATETQTSANDIIGVGFIGVGGRGSYLLELVLQLPGVAVRAVCDASESNRARAKELVTKAGQPAPQEYTQWKELLARADIDAVVSALPCDLHKQCYLDTIAAGKDLYGEKPMCLSVEDCEAVVTAANASDRIVQIGFQRRADPRFIEPIQQILAGELGELVEARVMWSNAWGPLYNWLGHREQSGDWMVEQAVHNWDVMNWVNQGLPVRAMGFGRGGYYSEKQPDRNVTDYYSALVEYPNGVVVNIIHSWLAPGQEGAMSGKFNDEYTRLIGTVGGIDFNSGLFSYRKETGRPDRPGYTGSAEGSNSKMCLAAFFDSMRTRKPPVANVEMGRDSVLACLLVREAVYRNGVITMDELRAA